MSKAFLTQAANDEDGTDPEKNIEDAYMQFFPKIGRDFVHKDDLVAILRELLDLLGADVDIDLERDTGARARASEYQSLLGQGKQGNDVYPDLIVLDDGSGDA